MKGYKFFITTTLIISLQFVKTMLGSQVLELMDGGGWAFYLTSCVSHAACLSLPALLVYGFCNLIHLHRAGKAGMVIMGIILSCLVAIDEQVYIIYRFHINGFVINMITGPAAGEIFNFDMWLYVKCAFGVLVISAIYIILWCVLCGSWKGRTRKIFHLPQLNKWRYAPLAAIMVCTLFAHCYHIYAAFYAKPSVIHSERLLPYYFPATSYGLMAETFHLTPDSVGNMGIYKAGGIMNYPKKDLQINETDSIRENILIILIDSWNPRSLTADCMPNVYRYALKNVWYKNHLSGSNGTKSGVFCLWYSIPSYYWDMAETSHIIPAVLSIAHREGYEFHNYPSASHIDPPFAKVLFAKEKKLRVNTMGNTSYERDCRITADIIHDLKSRKKDDAPFLSFLFYDLPHSFEYRKEYAHFTPSWTYADYSKLNNDTDPTPFWNLYRNTCYATDKNINKVLAALHDTGLDKNTVVIITGDHSQEFNENKKNYWGHNGNFSKAQIQVPLITHFPGDTPQTHYHRTTHYDIMPTIMKRVMGVLSNESDYSLGFQLSDKRSRGWHIVGSELNYGFVIERDTILEKDPSGTFSVYDSHMNIVSNYHLNHRKFKTALDKMYYFLSQ